MRPGLMITTAAILLVLCVAAAGYYLRDIGRHYDRVGARSSIIESPGGNVEFTDRGDGIPVLVIHGSGGGFDQGELIADALLDADFRTIVPSRFGYLRSTFDEGATWDEQAQAYAFLLDKLGIDRVAVVAMSHGGPSALLFAALHPERVSSLTLVSCGVVSSASGDQAAANEKGDMLVRVFRYDLPYWTITKLFRKRFMELLGATDTVIARLTVADRQLIGRIIDDMNPASLRTAGVVFDNRAALPGARIAAIEAPTLILHAKDDTLQLFHNAEFAASSIPAAELVAFNHGGHVLIAVEQAALASAAQAHIRRHAGGR